METLRVRIPGKEYDILIGRALLGEAGKRIGERLSPRKALVVTDENVGPLYAESLIAGLSAAGIEARAVSLPPGEETKSLAMLERLYDEALAFGITRADLMLALGGGVVGDLTGFAAATLLRGVPLVQVPTSLLAQVDSSVGGKTAVNLKQGKNLAGAFYQPALVLIDTGCLRTLPDRFLSDGMAEVLKYALIADRGLFGTLCGLEGREALFEKLPGIICRCCDIKRALVEEDEEDRGRRMLLNFGHTLGHAYEAAYHYKKYTHGEAVAIGMCAEALLGENLGVTPRGTHERIRAAAEGFGLPTSAETGAEDCYAAVRHDKKTRGGEISLVLLKEIGEAVIHRMPLDSLLSHISKL